MLWQFEGVHQWLGVCSDPRVGREVRREEICNSYPLVGNFAMWGGLFSTFDCALAGYPFYFVLIYIYI